MIYFLLWGKHIQLTCIMLKLQFIHSKKYYAEALEPELRMSNCCCMWRLKKTRKKLLSQNCYGHLILQKSDLETRTLIYCSLKVCDQIDKIIIYFTFKKIWYKGKANKQTNKTTFSSFLWLKYLSIRLTKWLISTKLFFTTFKVPTLFTHN